MPVPDQYRPRPISFLGLHSAPPWQVKLYGIAADSDRPRQTVIDAAIDALPAQLPTHETLDPAIGFAIAHDAADFCFVLIDWFANGNEIHQRMLVAPLDRPAALTPCTGHAIGCVWELEVVDFERRAWLRHVVTRPDRPGYDKYLTTTFEGHI